jgi:hypothetical protein
MGRIPDFLIIGAQKCGTSWLHHQLRQADGIYMREDKDHEHFSYVGNLNPGAFRRYCRRFDEAADAQRAGDANAAYFWTRTGSPWGRQPDSFNPDIPGSIRAFCGPDLKLLLILRHPVDRAVSAYLHHIRHGAITAATSILEPDLPLGIVDMGLYRSHLANWLAVYPRENLHLITDLPADNAAAVDLVEAVCRFLAVIPPPRERYYLEPIFPGWRRIADDRGVWVETAVEGRLSGALGDGPLCAMDGRQYRRVISPEELLELHRILDSHHIGQM